MKGILTFTLAAGVAISTSTVVQAAGVAKGAASVSKAPTSTSTPVGIGGMGLTLDRNSLNRELSRLNDLLAPQGTEDDLGADAPVQPKGLIWAF